ncbi:MAG: TadE/TadG family type IV pilus assembly protein [Acidimicrobiales bacterium]
MCGRRCSADDRERGAALVEFALVAPILFSLILFLSTGATALNRQITLNHAADEGARFGAVVPPNQTFASGTWATNVRDLVIARSGGELAASTGASVCVSLVQGNTPTVVSSPNPATWYSTKAGGAPCDTGDTYALYNPPFDVGLRVQVVVTRSAHLEAIAFSSSVSLDATAIARSETKP